MQSAPQPWTASRSIQSAVLEFNQSRCGNLCFVYDALVHNASRNPNIKLSVGPSWEMGIPSESVEGPSRVVSALLVIANTSVQWIHPSSESWESCFCPERDFWVRGRGLILSESLWPSPHASPLSLCGGPSLGTRVVACGLVTHWGRSLAARGLTLKNLLC